MLSASDPGLRRVSVHAGTAVVDVALPAAVPVATLIPSIVDILEDRGADRSGDQPATALPAVSRPARRLWPRRRRWRRTVSETVRF